MTGGPAWFGGTFVNSVTAVSALGSTCNLVLDWPRMGPQQRCGDPPECILR